MKYLRGDELAKNRKKYGEKWKNMEKYVPADLPKENAVAVSTRLAPHAAPFAPSGHQLRGSAPRTERSILCPPEGLVSSIEV